VEADFAVELGPDDETLEFPWSDESSGLRYFNLKRQPELLSEIEEARVFPELAEFLRAMNGAASLLETAKCDAWHTDKMNVEDEIFGAACKFGSYVDLVFVDDSARFSFAEIEGFADCLVTLLKKVPEIPASAEFLIRRCFFRGGEQTRDGFYMTFYLFGYGEDEDQCRQRWGIALTLVQSAILQLSRADSASTGSQRA
jgi:hypothetical protein